MSTRERPADRGRRRCRARILEITGDARRTRIGAGLSQAEVARAVGCSHSRIGRLERGQVRVADLDLLSAYCGVVGLDLVIRAYPGGDPIRDAGQIALLERLRSRLAPGLRWRTEVPLARDGDLRAWDAVVSGSGWRCRIEAETRLADVQATTRRIALKARDDPAGHVVLVVAETRRNRSALAVSREGLRDLFPIDARELLTALRAGRDPGGNGILIL